MPEVTEGESGRRRGEGRGSNFFVLDRDIWEAAWTAKTGNRLNMLTALLVLLAGTGADHRLTKWSAKACEDRAGMGKPRAKVAIEELIAAGLAEHTDASSRSFPQYRLAAPSSALEPIFLPVQLVIGFGDESPILRRVRETGDVYLLRMLIDLYGLIQTDATHGVPIETLREYFDGPEACRKITEMGANAVWALTLRNSEGTAFLQGQGDWRTFHAKRAKSDEDQFWPRVKALQNIGALWYEPWVFSHDALDAEPLFPIFHSEFQASQPPSREVALLSEIITDAAEALIGDRTYLVEQNSDKFLLPLPTHHQPPAVRGVARLRVEADTPGRRLAYGKRMRAIEGRTAAYKELLTEARAGRYKMPVKLA